MTDTGLLLSNYVDGDQLVAQLRISRKTLQRYEALPDGLPSVKIGARKFYRLEAVRRWIEARETRPNPRRAAPRGIGDRTSSRVRA